jgi:hypothetical protein
MDKKQLRRSRFAGYQDLHSRIAVRSVSRKLHSKKNYELFPMSLIVLAYYGSGHRLACVPASIICLTSVVSADSSGSGLQALGTRLLFRVDDRLSEIAAEFFNESIAHHYKFDRPPCGPKLE